MTKKATNCFVVSVVLCATLLPNHGSEAAIAYWYGSGLCYTTGDCDQSNLLYPNIVSFCKCWYSQQGLGYSTQGACLDLGSPGSGQCQLEDKSTGCDYCESIGIYGDPHINTWSGRWYDYHGQCDLVFVHAPNFGKGVGLDIHVRTRIRYDYSYIESVALRIGTEETLEVSGFGLYLLNGISAADMPATIAGCPLSHSQVGSNRHTFSIEAHDGTRIIISTFKDIVSIKLEHGQTMLDHFEGSEGLMGSLDTGDPVARDGVTILEDPIAFGQEWQVRDTEPMIFQQPNRNPQYPEKCKLPTPSGSGNSRRLGESVSQEAAERACKRWKTFKKVCVYDVMATGDLELADAGVY